MTVPTGAGGAPRGPVVTFAPKIGSRVGSALVTTGVLAIAGVLGVIEPRQWAVWLLVALQLPAAVIRWREISRVRRQAWALRVDGAGIWWNPQGPPMSWASIATIEIHQARGWRRLLPHWSRVLLVDHAAANFARRAGTRPMGRSVGLDRVRATPEELVAAFRPFTDAPAALRLR